MKIFFPREVTNFLTCWKRLNINYAAAEVLTPQPWEVNYSAPYLLLFHLGGDDFELQHFAGGAAYELGVGGLEVVLYADEL